MPRTPDEQRAILSAALSEAATVRQAYLPLELHVDTLGDERAEEVVRTVRDALSALEDHLRALGRATYVQTPTEPGHAPA